MPSAHDHDWDALLADPESAVHAYRTHLDWPVHTHSGVVWMAPGLVADALNVPRDIGERALAHLDGLGLQSPVISIPGDAPRYSFLAHPYDGAPGEILALFTDLDIGYAHGGYHLGRASEWGIDLPPTQHPGAPPRTWLRAPDLPLLPLNLIVTTVLAALQAIGDELPDS